MNVYYLKFSSLLIQSGLLKPQEVSFLLLVSSYPVLKLPRKKVCKILHIGEHKYEEVKIKLLIYNLISVKSGYLQLKTGLKTSSEIKFNLDASTWNLPLSQVNEVIAQGKKLNPNFKFNGKYIHSDEHMTALINRYRSIKKGQRYKNRDLNSIVEVCFKYCGKSFSFKNSIQLQHDKTNEIVSLEKALSKAIRLYLMSLKDKHKKIKMGENIGPTLKTTLQDDEEKVRHLLKKAPPGLERNYKEIRRLIAEISEPNLLEKRLKPLMDEIN